MDIITTAGRVSTDISTVHPSAANESEANRIKFVTDLAAISRGKTESSNPEGRYKQLLKEAALGTPSRPLEFLPVVFKYRIHKVDGGLHVTLSKKVKMVDSKLSLMLILTGSSPLHHLVTIDLYLTLMKLYLRTETLECILR